MNIENIENIDLAKVEIRKLKNRIITIKDFENILNRDGFSFLNLFTEEYLKNKCFYFYNWIIHFDDLTPQQNNISDKVIEITNIEIL